MKKNISLFKFYKEKRKKNIIFINSFIIIKLIGFQMTIQQAVLDDLIEVLYLLKTFVNDLNEKGHKHWNNAYPGIDFMTEAIKNKTLYIYKDNGIVISLVVLSNTEPSEYKNIKWKGKSDKVLFVSFLAVHPNWQEKGVSKKMIEYAEDYAKKQAYNTIRFDIYSGLNDADKFYVDMGYTQTGEFHSEFQQNPYFTFEKNL